MTYTVHVRHGRVRLRRICAIVLCLFLAVAPAYSWRFSLRTTGTTLAQELQRFQDELRAWLHRVLVQTLTTAITTSPHPSQPGDPTRSISDPPMAFASSPILAPLPIEADLEVTIDTDLPGPVPLSHGSPMEVVITLRNEGPADATNIRAEVRLSANGIVLDADAPPWLFDGQTWTPNALSGESFVMLYLTIGLVEQSEADELTLELEIMSADTTDPDSEPGNGELNEDDHAQLSKPVLPYEPQDETCLIEGWVWDDADASGAPEEDLATAGINGVSIQLQQQIAPDEFLVVATTLSRTGPDVTSGYYRFESVLPGTYRIALDTATVPPPFARPSTPLTYDVVCDPLLGPDAEQIPPLFGLIAEPTAIGLMHFYARPNGDGTTTLTWRTAVEMENLGFRLYAADTIDGARRRVTPTLIPGQGTSAGTTYQHIDTIPGIYYWLEDIDWHFQRTLHGPVRADVP